MSEETKEETNTKTDIIEEANKTDAESSISEDTSVNLEQQIKAYEALFEKQKSEMEKLNREKSSLQNQINILMRNGSVTATATNEQNNEAPKENIKTTENDEDYISLSELGKEIGKKDYERN